MEGETIEQTTFTVPSVGDGDRDRILDALSGVNGVRDVEVRPDSHAVVVTYDPREVSTPLLQERLSGAGFTIGQETSAGPSDMSQNALT